MLVSSRKGEGPELVRCRPNLSRSVHGCSFSCRTRCLMSPSLASPACLIGGATNAPHPTPDAEHASRGHPALRLAFHEHPRSTRTQPTLHACRAARPPAGTAPWAKAWRACFCSTSAPLSARAASPTTQPCPRAQPLAVLPCPQVRRRGQESGEPAPLPTHRPAGGHAPGHRLAAPEGVRSRRGGGRPGVSPGLAEGLRPRRGAGKPQGGATQCKGHGDQEER